MKTNKTSSLVAAGILTLSILACNLGKGPGPSDTLSSPETSAPTTEASSGNSSNPLDACANPYQPTTVNATWNYKLTSSVSDTFTRSILAVEADGFTDQDIFGTGVTRQGKWRCDNGNLIALDPSGGGSASVNTEGVSVDFQTIEASGVTLPATINPGNEWTQTTTLEGIETINGTEIPAKNEFSSACKAVGVESVTVEAGTFDAMRVECQTNMKITITMQDNPIETAIVINATNWYAENIGLIKTVSTGEGFNSTVELTSYNIP